MVWGMALPGSFGDFFPDGAYVGWKEARTEYFYNRMPADQRAIFNDDVSTYRYYVAENFINEPGLKRPDLPPFGPIAAHEAPKRFETIKSYASLGSLIKLNDRILAVDGHLMHIIECFEPGMHHFFPIEIVMGRKVISPKQYYVMAIGQYLDSFSPEESDPASWKERGEEHFSFEEGKKPMSGLALSGRIFGGAHLWRERRMTNVLVCFSDQLMSEIALSALRLPKHYRLKEI